MENEEPRKSLYPLTNDGVVRMLMFFTYFDDRSAMVRYNLGQFAEHHRHNNWEHLEYIPPFRAWRGNDPILANHEKLRTALRLEGLNRHISLKACRVTGDKPQ